MQSDRAALHVDGVWFAYDALPVVRDVSIGLRSGEMVALAGPNGSGKSTLLKLLTGVRRPSRGQALLDGQPIARLPMRLVARHIAVVSQHIDAALMFTVERLVMMGRTPHTGFLGFPGHGDREAVESALQATELGPLANRRFGELSGGEQQRVMLAMALAQETRFLLLDEPTVHLDLHHQHELLELLRTLNAQRGIGVVAVMHDLNLAALYFDRLAVMQEGRLVADGPAGETVARPEVLAVFRAPLAVVPHPQTGVPQVLLQRR